MVGVLGRLLKLRSMELDREPGAPMTPPPMAGGGMSGLGWASLEKMVCLISCRLGWSVEGRGGYWALAEREWPPALAGVGLRRRPRSGLLGLMERGLPPSREGRVGAVLREERRLLAMVDVVCFPHVPERA